MDPLREAFDARAAAWEAYTQTPGGRLREALSWRYLLPHLPAAPTRILDAGCGTGNLALRLAALGHHVVLLDLSQEMLNLAAAKARAQGAAHLVETVCAPVEALPDLAACDAVICHTLLEYLAEPEATIRALVGKLRAGGLFSLVFVNRHAEPLSYALAKGDLVAARDALTADQARADLFGVPRRLFEFAPLRQALRDAGLRIAAEYGVRIFADYLCDPAWREAPDAFEALVELEAAAAARPPYSLIGRYGQIIGKLVDE